MPGSDQKINYQIRPAKSVERKMMCELIREILILERKHDFRYIGMGAKYFADFVLFHNEFGISDMISIEADSKRSLRYNFNKPLKSIEIKFGASSQILPQISDFDKKMNVVWLDYDGRFSSYMLDDIDILSKNLFSGSLFFISCNYSFLGDNPGDKRDSFWKGMEEYKDDSIPKNMYTSKSLPKVIRRICNNKIQKSIEQRNRGNLLGSISCEQLVFFTYKDGANMMTIGWIIADESLQKSIDVERKNNRLPYITNTDDYYSIDIPKLTFKEMQFILAHFPEDEEEYKNNVRSEKNYYYGIEYSEIDQFKKIYRYYPFYTEGRMNT